MYRKVELYDGITIAPLKIVKGTGMSVYGGLGISKAFLPEMMTEDQHYRRKYRNALIEINNIIQPFKDTMDIFKEISKIMERCDI
jgi:hypothetical protein